VRNPDRRRRDARRHNKALQPRVPRRALRDARLSASPFGDGETGNHFVGADPRGHGRPHGVQRLANRPLGLGPVTPERLFGWPHLAFAGRRAYERFVQVRFYVDPETGQPHIRRHAVTDQEVIEVLGRPLEDRAAARAPDDSWADERWALSSGSLCSGCRAELGVCDHGV